MDPTPKKSERLIPVMLPEWLAEVYAPGERGALSAACRQALVSAPKKSERVSGDDMVTIQFILTVSEAQEFVDRPNSRDAFHIRDRVVEACRKALTPQVNDDIWAKYYAASRRRRWGGLRQWVRRRS